MIGLAASLAADLPSGPMIVCAIAGLGLLVLVVSPLTPEFWTASAKFFGEAGPAKAIATGHGASGGRSAHQQCSSPVRMPQMNGVLQRAQRDSGGLFFFSIPGKVFHRETQEAQLRADIAAAVADR